MHAFLRTFGLWLALVCLAAGCSTPGIRARQHAEAYRRLSTSDQKLVRHGHVRPGLSAEGVYIAWGEPDAKTAGGAGKDGTETWVYRQRVTLYDPMSFYDHFGPSHGYGDWPREPWLRPGYGIGGIGNEGLLEYRPNVRSLDTLRIAEFRGGNVDRYKDAGRSWQQSPPKAVKPTPVAHARKASTAKKAKHSAKSTGKTHNAAKHSVKTLEKTHPKAADSHGKRVVHHAQAAHAHGTHGSRLASSARR